MDASMIGFICIAIMLIMIAFRAHRAVDGGDRLRRLRVHRRVSASGGDTRQRAV